MNDRQREKCMISFTYFDKNSNGKIDKAELKSALQKYGILSLASIEVIVKEASEIDSDGIDFEEFCNFIAPKLKLSLPAPQDIKTCFKVTVMRQNF